MTKIDNFEKWEDEWKKRKNSPFKMYSLEEIQEFFELLGASSKLSIDELLDYAEDPGLPWRMKYNRKQKWKFEFREDSKDDSKVWGIFAKNTITGTTSEWIRDSSEKIISFNTKEEAKKFALSWILNKIDFSDSFQSQATELLKQKMERLGKKFDI